MRFERITIPSKYRDRKLLWMGMFSVSFLLIALPDVWVWYQMLLHYVPIQEPMYSQETLFWLFVLVMLAPIIPLANFYGGNLNIPLFAAILFAALVLYFNPKGVYFIPSLPMLEVILLFASSYSAIAIRYLSQESKLENKTNGVSAVIKLLSFFAGFCFISLVSPLFITDQDSFFAIANPAILFAIPLYLFFLIAYLYTRNRSKPAVLDFWVKK